jgi:hypothetical protein
MPEEETLPVPHSPKFSKEKILIIVAVVGGLIVVALGSYLFLTRNRAKDMPNQNQNDQSQNSGSGDMFAMQYGRNCENKSNVSFTSSPLALDKMASIEPLGKTSDGHVTPIDHVYVAPISQSVPDNTYDVVMPADGKVVSIGRMPAEYIGDRTDVKLAPDDFRLVMSFSCRYFSIFIHVHKLSPALASAVGDVKPSETKDVDVSLKAGDLLAHLGGNPFDWTLVDTQTTLKGFITPSLYQREPWKIHTISPFDVYSGDLKTSLENKSLRTVAPLGGKLDWDKPGALIGNWFKQGTNGYQGASQDRYWDGHLSIAPDHIDPSGIIYSTGNWQGVAKQFVVKGDFDPATITSSSGLVKIELINYNYLLASGASFNGGSYVRGMRIDKSSASVVGTVLLQVGSGEKLKMEQFSGKSAAQVTGFSDKAVSYER